jgi:hypothetical protein
MNRFDIKHQLGVGSFGVVMLARHKANGKEVSATFSCFLLSYTRWYTHSKEKLVEQGTKETKEHVVAMEDQRFSSTAKTVLANPCFELWHTLVGLPLGS